MDTPQEGQATGVDFGSAQTGDVEIGNIAGADLNNYNIHGLTGADVARILAEIRAITAITEHRGRMQDLEAEAHRVMSRQRIEVIAADARALRWWVAILTVVIFLAAMVIAALVYDRLAIVAGLALASAAAAIRGRYP